MKDNDPPLLEAVPTTSKKLCNYEFCNISHNDGIMLNNTLEITFPRMKANEKMHLECYIEKCIQEGIKENLLTHKDFS